MEAFVPYEIDLAVSATQEEKTEFLMFLVDVVFKILGKIGGQFVDQSPEKFRKFFKIMNREGSAKEVN
jgi:hypothetical protein